MEAGILHKGKRFVSFYFMQLNFSAKDRLKRGKKQVLFQLVVCSFINTKTQKATAEFYFDGRIQCYPQQ